MDSLSPQVVSAAKLPILNPNEFDLWKIRIEQYFLMTDYSLWEVILNGDSHIPIRVIEGVVQHVAPTTTEQRLARKNKLKARGTLLMALPDKHKLKFNIHKDAKTLMEAIEKRFCRNKETKKKLISQLEILEESLSQEDINLKFLKSLPTEWRTHTLIWKNKTDLEDQTLDDLFNSLKIYEAEVKSSSSASTSTQNNAFVSSQNTNSTNESVSAVTSVSTASVKTGRNMRANGTTSIGFDMSKVECYNYHRRGHFARECRSPKDTRRNVPVEPQRRNVPVETFTSNALVSQCDGVGSYDWSFQAEEEPTNYALMAFTFSSSSSSDNEVSSCSKACTKAYATLQSHYDKLTNDLRKSQFDVISYKTGLESVEARILVYQQNEPVFEEDIKLLKLDVHLRDNALVVLRQKFKKAEQERDELKLKLEKFQTSSKNLSQLLASQTNDKTGLGYDNQVFTSSMFDCDEMFSSESDVSMPASPVYDRYQSREGYHVVPPPYTGTFMPPKPDLIFHDAPNVNEIVHTAFNIELSPTKSDKDLSHMPSAPIIEDWNDPSFVQPTKQVKTPRLSVKPVEHSIPDANHKTDIPKLKSHGNSRNRKHYVRMTHPNPQRHVVPTAVLTRSRLVLLTTARPFTTAISQPHVTRPRQAKTVVTKPHSPPRRNINRRPSPNPSNFPQKVTTAKVPHVNVVKVVQGNWHALKDKGVIDSGCSRHMTGNMSYLSEYEEINGGYVAFDTECIVLSPDFKLPDENQVLLKVPRENNMYNVNLKNIVPSGDLTCLFAKATLDKSNLWHRRLGHINFKTMNKLDKGKQHRDSCKTKPVISVSQPLQRMKEIKREFSVPRTPQQNGIAERKNRTLIEAARTMLVDLLLAILFWTEAVNTACFMRPFGCPVTILNTLDPLSKFDGKADEGFLVGYFITSKAFRVFNSRIRIIQETLHINFLENKPNVAGSGPTWLFDIDTLTKSMNYQPVTVGNQPNPSAGIQEQFDAEKAEEENVQQFVLFPLRSSGSKDPQNTDGDATFDVKEPEFEGKKRESEVHVSPSNSVKKKKRDDKTKRETNGMSHVELSTRFRNLSEEFEDFSDNSINEVNAAGTPVPAVGQILINSTNTFSAVGPSNTVVSPTHRKSSYMDTSQYPDDLNILALEEITYSDDEEDVGAEADFTNLETNITVSPIPTTRVHKDHPVT
nr:hypothetical protein [Tanacetum cinerariifolium]